MSLGREATNETEHAEFVGAYEALNEHGTRLLTKLANLYIKLGYAEGLSWGALSTAVDVQNKVIEQVCSHLLCYRNIVEIALCLL